MPAIARAGKSVVVIVIRLRVGNQGIMFQFLIWIRDFSLLQRFWVYQPPIEWVKGALILCVNQLGLKVKHCP
jgi:hypothetical protein